MEWSLKQKGWRALFIRMALLTVLWLMVVFVFATEFYLSARGGPIKISWMVAAGSAFRDWFPWVLLSPLAILLAGRFRFNRDNWRRSLIIHATACVLFTIAYEGLLLLAYPAPFILSTGGGIGVFSTGGGMPPGLPAFDSSVEAIGPPSLPFPASSNAVVFESGNLHAGVEKGPMPLSANPNTVTTVRGGEVPSLAPPAGRAFGFSTFRPLSKWTQFLHLAMMRTQFTIPIYLCIVCICWVINHFQESSERERRTLELETRLTQANLRALKMQLQPHFLFNTLNAISSLIHENPKVADDMIGSLSQFLRTTLEISARNEVPLHTELEFVDRYLEIQQTRFGERLQIHRELDSTVMDALVPPLILQPLVENAIRHGIESRETGGTVTIRALREGDVLRLEISDNGEGFSGGQLLGVGNGIGLSNTKARLQELYGDKNQFKLTAIQPAGASVKIEIPFQTSHFGAENEA
jgi:two-component sensor histidine kinase